MFKKRVNVWLLCVLLLLTITGCKKINFANEGSKEEQIAFKEKKGEEVGKINTDISTVINTGKASEHTTEDSMKESGTGNTSVRQKDATSSTSNNNNTSSPTTNAYVHTHNFVEQIQTITHSEKGHYETKVIQEAYDEEVYAWRTFCNKCGEDLTDLGAEGLTIHSAILCESGYHNDYVVVDTIHHDAETKQVWVVDEHGYTETITSWKCECGETKD